MTESRSRIVVFTCVLLAALALLVPPVILFGLERRSARDAAAAPIALPPEPAPVPTVSLSHVVSYVDDMPAVSPGTMTLSSSSSWATCKVREATCDRCGAPLHFSGNVYVHDITPSGARLAFRGCTRCLVEVLDDYAHITSQDLTAPRAGR